MASVRSPSNRERRSSVRTIRECFDVKAPRPIAVVNSARSTAMAGANSSGCRPSHRGPATAHGPKPGSQNYSTKLEPIGYARPVDHGGDRHWVAVVGGDDAQPDGDAVWPVPATAERRRELPLWGCSTPTAALAVAALRCRPGRSRTECVGRKPGMSEPPKATDAPSDSGSAAAELTCRTYRSVAIVSGGLWLHIAPKVSI